MAAGCPGCDTRVKTTATQPSKILLEQSKDTIQIQLFLKPLYCLGRKRVEMVKTGFPEGHCVHWTGSGTYCSFLWLAREKYVNKGTLVGRLGVRNEALFYLASFSATSATY